MSSPAEYPPAADLSTTWRLTLGGHGNQYDPSERRCVCVPVVVG